MQDNPLMNVMQMFLSNSQAPQMPPMDWGSSFINDTFHNWKMKRLETEVTRRKNILTTANENLTAQLQMVITMTTFNDRMKLEQDSIKFQIQMKEADKKIREEQAKQEEIKTKTMEVELMTLQLTLQKMSKEMKDDSSA